MRGLTRLILLIILLVVGGVAFDRHHDARDLEAQLQIAQEESARYRAAFEAADTQAAQLRAAMANLERGLTNVQNQLAAREAELLALRLEPAGAGDDP